MCWKAPAPPFSMSNHHKPRALHGPSASTLDAISRGPGKSHGGDEDLDAHDSPEHGRHVVGRAGIPLGIWVAVVAAAPLFYGSVGWGSQLWIGLAAGGCLLALTLVGAREEIEFPVWAALAFWGIALVSIVPMPLGLVEWVSPERARLARDFAVDPSDVGGWATLSLSPAESVQRLFQLATLWAAFLLAVVMGRNLRFTPIMALALVVGIALLGATEIWFRLDGTGVWEKARHHPAGTFANRNHFANWMIMAGFLAGGAALFGHRRATKGDLHWRPIRNALVLAALGGFYLAVSCGSRGGLVSLAVGGVFWYGWMLVDQRMANRPVKSGGARRGANLLAPLLAFSGLVAVALGSGEALDRLASGSLDFKAEIWRDALAMGLRFPWFGIGPGAFNDAFPIYKTIGAGLGFLHVENDYIELAATGGLAGLASAMALLACFGVVVWKNRSLAGRERKFLLLGSGAAMVAFACHAGFEFVSHVPSNALLGATCAGLFWGYVKPRKKRHGSELAGRAAHGRIALSVGLLLFTVWSGLGAWRMDRLERGAASAEAFEAWGSLLASRPHEPVRLIRHLRAYAAWSAADPGAASQLPPSSVAAQTRRILRWNPLNWPARLEQAWFELTHFSDLSRGFDLAGIVHRLNPSQPAIPMGFARFLVSRDPEKAIEALKWVKSPNAGELKEMLSIAWRGAEDPGLLWRLTPATAAGWGTLGEFATGIRLFPLARAALERAAAEAPSVDMAAKLITLGQPDLALLHLPRNSAEMGIVALRFEALRRAGAHGEAVTLAEALSYGALARTLVLGPADRAILTAKLRGDTAGDLDLLVQAIEQGFTGKAARLLPLAAGLLEDYPQMHALRWACFRLAMEMGRPRDALDFIAPTVATLR